MKRINKMVTLSIMIAGVYLSSCTSRNEKVSNAQGEMQEAQKDLENAKDKVDIANENLKSANASYLKEYETYKVETSEKIIANQKSIEEFRARIANDKTVAKAEYEKKIADLDKKNSDMKMKLENFKASSKENWEEFKTEFNHDMEELGKAFRDLTVKNTNK